MIERAYCSSDQLIGFNHHEHIVRQRPGLGLAQEDCKGLHLRRRSGMSSRWCSRATAARRTATGCGRGAPSGAGPIAAASAVTATNPSLWGLKAMPLASTDLQIPRIPRVPALCRDAAGGAVKGKTLANDQVWKPVQNSTTWHEGHPVLLAYVTLQDLRRCVRPLMTARHEDSLQGFPHVRGISRMTCKSG